jgi:hypothetical protein
MPKALGELARQLWNWCTLAVLFLMLSLVAVGLQSGRKAASIKGGSAVAETIANNFDQAGSARTPSDLDRILREARWPLEGIVCPLQSDTPNPAE